MDHQFLSFFIPLTAAHVLADFLTQSDDDVLSKHRLAVLLKHGLKVGLFSYLLLGMPAAWDLVLGLVVTHLIIDYLKVRSRKGSYLSRFFFDQGAHLLILLVFSWAAAGFRYQTLPSFWALIFGHEYYRALTLLTGGVLAVYVGSFVVEHLFQSLEAGGSGEEGRAQALKEARKEWDSLGFKEGGKVIGYLERSLIFVFVMAGLPEGIGFLIAAKSIFRFGELTNPERREQAEIVIIGTLMSILFGTALSYLTKMILTTLMAAP